MSRLTNTKIHFGTKEAKTNFTCIHVPCACVALLGTIKDEAPAPGRPNGDDLKFRRVVVKWFTSKIHRIKKTRGWTPSSFSSARAANSPDDSLGERKGGGKNQLSLARGKVTAWPRAGKAQHTTVVYVSKPLWHIPLLCVHWKNSWWWAEELSETCRILLQIKFDKLMNLVGFIIRIKIYIIMEFS